MCGATGRKAHPKDLGGGALDYWVCLHMKWLFRNAILVGGLTALSCGKESATPFEPTPPKTGIVGISVSPASATISVGDTVRFRAVVTGIQNGDTTAAWASANPTIASVDSVKGLVRGIAPGNVTVTVTARYSANFKASVQVTVVQ
jgi:uncharacterized protein YjdB